MKVRDLNLENRESEKSDFEKRAPIFVARFHIEKMVCGVSLAPSFAVFHELSRVLLFISQLSTPRELGAFESG